MTRHSVDLFAWHVPDDPDLTYKDTDWMVYYELMSGVETTPEAGFTREAFNERYKEVKREIDFDRLDPEQHNQQPVAEIYWSSGDGMRCELLSDVPSESGEQS